MSRSEDVLPLRDIRFPRVSGDEPALDQALTGSDQVFPA